MGSAIFCLLLCAGGPIPIYAAGIPLYGRAFENTNGIGQPYSGVTSGNPPPFPTSTAHRSKFAPDVGSRHLPVQVAPTPGRAGVRRPRGRGELLVRPGQARARVVRRARHGADQGQVCACQGARGVYVLGGALSVGGGACVLLRVARCSWLESLFFCVCAVRQLSSDKTGTASLVYTAGVTLGQLDQTPVRRAHLLHLG